KAYQKNNQVAGGNQQWRTHNQQQAANGDIGTAAAKRAKCAIGEGPYQWWHEQRDDRRPCRQPRQECRLPYTAYLAGGNKQQKLCWNNQRQQRGILGIQGEPQKVQY